jgi:hypothetical protein
MSGWRKRQINDAKMPSMQDQASYLEEPDGTHEGSWPQEALHVLRLPPSTPAGKSLLRSKPVVDVLSGGTGRREDRLAGPAGGEGMVGDRSSEGQTK